jgi:hypothetical protein
MDGSKIENEAPVFHIGDDFDAHGTGQLNGDVFQSPGSVSLCGPGSRIFFRWERLLPGLQNTHAVGGGRLVFGMRRRVLQIEGNRGKSPRIANGRRLVEPGGTLTRDSLFFAAFTGVLKKERRFLGRAG